MASLIVRIIVKKKKSTIGLLIITSSGNKRLLDSISKNIEYDMFRYYNIPNKVNLPIISPTTDIDSIFICKSKPSIIIENEKKIPWSIKHRHANISTSKENTSPRRITTHHKFHKSCDNMIKPGLFC